MRTLWICPKMYLPSLIIIQSCYFDYRINKSFACSRCMICFFVFCSLDLDVLGAQRIIGVLSWLYSQINAVRKSNDMDSAKVGTEIKIRSFLVIHCSVPSHCVYPSTHSTSNKVLVKKKTGGFLFQVPGCNSNPEQRKTTLWRSAKFSNDVQGATHCSNIFCEGKQGYFLYSWHCNELTLEKLEPPPIVWKYCWKRL